MSKWTAYIMIGLARSLGGMSLLLFLIFLFKGHLNLLDVGLAGSAVLWFDAGLSFLFFIQHSGMIRKPFRRWLAGFISEEYAGVVYAIASGIVLISVMLLWQTGPTIVTVSGPLRWVLRAAFVLPLFGFFWGVRALRFFDPFGLTPVLNRLQGANPAPMPLTVVGPYRWARHPLYLFMIVMFWCYPDLTTDRLLFNILWTVWIVIGSYLEEIDLTAEFGDAYREYQKRVPMLVPLLRWPRREWTSVNEEHKSA